MHYVVFAIVDMVGDNTVAAIAVVEVEADWIVASPAVMDNRSEVVCSLTAVAFVAGIADIVN